MTATIEELLSETRRTRLLVLDSGVGGLAYVNRILNLRDGYTVYYVADTAGFPYGEKSVEELRGRIVRLVASALLRFPADLALVACNTASVTALTAVREAFPIPFVGTVPAVKPAAALTRTGVIALLATSATVEDDYTDRLVADFARKYEVIRSGASELVRRIEGGFPHLTRRRQVVDLARRELAAFRDAGADVVVLGCTHFLHITPLLSEIAAELGGDLRLVDSLDGVARRVLSLTRQEQLATQEGFFRSLVKVGRSRGARRAPLSVGSRRAPGVVTGGADREPRGVLVTTAEGGDRYREIATAFRLHYGGSLEL